MMSTEQIQLLGITKSDIQEIFERALKDFKEAKTRIIFLDASYLYTFHLDDFETVRKFNILGRYDLKAVLEWHKCLERWYQDQTVTIADRTFKPIKISRTLDRVVNEGMELIAGAVTGEDSGNFPFRSIGDGAIDFASPSDKVLVHEVDRIDVNDNPEGGSLSRDGTTIYSIGNHAKTIPTPNQSFFTECGMESTESPTTDMMLDHSVFVDPVPHIQNNDAPGSTTVIYMCSG